MKKIIVSIILLIIALSIYPVINIKADIDDYTTFTEIIMADGKLISNFTDEEYDELARQYHVEFAGISAVTANRNVDASYISNTIKSVENKSNTDITYTIDVETTTNNKTSFTASGSLNGQVSGSKGKLKGEIGAKAGVEYNQTNTVATKNVEKMNLVVEANSRALIYLTGNLTITNGACAYYICWIRVSEGLFEIAVLKNQYTRIEKAKIVWKR